MNNLKGFTLIELLLVVGIIAVLAAAIIVAISPGEQIQDAREATEHAQAQAIATSMWQCLLDEGSTGSCESWTDLDIPVPDHPEDHWDDTDNTQITWENDRPRVVGDYATYDF